MKTTTKLLTLAVLVGGMLLPSIANAQGPTPQLCTDFDSFNILNNPNPTLPSGADLQIGTVHGQDGWTPANLNGGWTVSDLWGYTMSSSGITPGLAVDEGVVVLPTGGNAWRISNGRDFGYAFSSLPFSPIVPDALVAGETRAYLYNAYGSDNTHPLSEPANQGRVAQTKHFCASFDFKSQTDGPQPGLMIEVDASAKQSATRYSWMRVEDNNGAGLDFNTDGGYAATGLSYNQWHHVEMEIEFVDGVLVDGQLVAALTPEQIDQALQGLVTVTGNDIVVITVDGGAPIVTTTWEDGNIYGYPFWEPTRYPHAVDCLMFRLPAGSALPALLGHGLLIDNVCVACSPGGTTTKKDCQKFVKQEKKAFDDGQQAAKKAFDDQQKAAKKAFDATHPTPAAKKAFDDGQQAAKKAFDDQQQAAKKAFEDAQKAEKQQCEMLP